MNNFTILRHPKTEDQAIVSVIYNFIHVCYNVWIVSDLCQNYNSSNNNNNSSFFRRLQFCHNVIQFSTYQYKRDDKMPPLYFSSDVITVEIRSQPIPLRMTKHHIKIAMSKVMNKSFTWGFIRPLHDLWVGNQPICIWVIVFFVHKQVYQSNNALMRKRKLMFITKYK